MSGHAQIELQNIEKHYGSYHALRDINLSIPKGQFVALVGPSGCGKSTLLRSIAGLETISGGTMRIAGTVVNDMPPRKRDLAMVFQSYALYPHMTVRQNLTYSLRLRRAGKAEIDKAADDVAKITGLENLLDRYPRELSGGQRQRVAMGRAIVRDPQVFLFDEPLSNLDAKLRVHMRAEIKALHQRLKTTTIYVTHDQVEAMTMADRIVVMRDGVIEQEGTPLDLYDEPANLFVAGFIGSPTMNFIDGRIEGDRFINDDGIDVAAPKGLADGPVVGGIRPNLVELGDKGTPFQVQVVEPTGAETHLVLTAGQTQIVALVQGRVSLQPGATTGVVFDPAGLHLFDRVTGARLSPPGFNVAGR